MYIQFMATINTDNNTMTITSDDGITVAYNRRYDRRVVGTADGRLITKTLKAARELAGEINAWSGLRTSAQRKTVVIF